MARLTRSNVTPESPLSPGTLGPAVHATQPKRSAVHFWARTSLRVWGCGRRRATCTKETVLRLRSLASGEQVRVNGAGVWTFAGVWEFADVLGICVFSAARDEGSETGSRVFCCCYTDDKIATSVTGVGGWGVTEDWGGGTERGGGGRVGVTEKG